MPKIRWKDLPPALPEHLFERLRDRKINAGDLYELKLSRESEPEAPEATILGVKRSRPVPSLPCPGRHAHQLFEHASEVALFCESSSESHFR